MKIFLFVSLLLFAGFLFSAPATAVVSETETFHSAVLEGRLIKLRQPQGEAAYRLSIVINQKEYDIAYASSTRIRLDIWNGRHVRIEGVRKWLPGMSLPCIEVRKITPLWNR